MKRNKNIITIDPGKRGGQPVIRGLRITVADVLDMLASGMDEKNIIADFPELTEADIHAALAYAANRERATTVVMHETASRSKSFA